LPTPVCPMAIEDGILLIKKQPLAAVPIVKGKRVSWPKTRMRHTCDTRDRC
jgi:hypothetical protein